MIRLTLLFILIGSSLFAQEIEHVQKKQTLTVNIQEYETVQLKMYGSRFFKSELVLSDEWGTEEYVIKLDKHCKIMVEGKTVQIGKKVNYGQEGRAFWDRYMDRMGFDKSDTDKTGGKKNVTQNFATGQIQSVNTPTNYFTTYLKRQTN